MLRTRSPLVSGIATLLPFDLHVLGLPLALILSQDQTLRSKVYPKIFVRLLTRPDVESSGGPIISLHFLSKSSKNDTLYVKSSLAFLILFWGCKSNNFFITFYILKKLFIKQPLSIILRVTKIQSHK